MRISIFCAFAFVSLLTTACVSAMVTKASARGREVLQGGTAKADISAHFGGPESAVPAWLEQKADRQLSDGETWAVWKIKGRPAQVDDGGAQTTVSGMTLGMSEVVLLPMALIAASSDSGRMFYLIGVFGPDERLRRHLAVQVP